MCLLRKYRSCFKSCLKRNDIVIFKTVISEGSIYQSQNILFLSGGVYTNKIVGTLCMFFFGFNHTIIFLTLYVVILKSSYQICKAIIHSLDFDIRKLHHQYVEVECMNVIKCTVFALSIKIV